MKSALPIMLFLLLSAGCNRPETVTFTPDAADSAKILSGIAEYRQAADAFFRGDPSSPFARDTSVTFTGIRWFTPDVGFVVKSKLFRYEKPETVNVLGTKGEVRKHLKYGYFFFRLAGSEVRLNVYKFLPDDARRKGIGTGYLSLWFTDLTTGQETYPVGRYLELEEENPDPEFVYTLDFNRSYNPYCAYSPVYSCAIPPKEDRIPVAVRAGERTYHD